MTLIAIALTFASGANDVASFTRLGGVFTSVMTGNIVLWGLSAAQRSVSLFSHTAVSIAGYITGVAGGTWVAHGFKVHGDGKPDETDRDSVLPGPRQLGAVHRARPAGRVHRRVGDHRRPAGRVGGVRAARGAGGGDGRAVVIGQ